MRGVLVNNKQLVFYLNQPVSLKKLSDQAVILPFFFFYKIRMAGICASAFRDCKLVAGRGWQRLTVRLYEWFCDCIVLLRVFLVSCCIFYRLFVLRALLIFCLFCV